MSRYSVRPAREGPVIVDSNTWYFLEGGLRLYQKPKHIARCCSTTKWCKDESLPLLANISIHTIRSAVVLVLHNTYDSKNADRLYFVTGTTVRITAVLHPAGVLLQGFTCIAHPGQSAIEYAYWYFNRLGYCTWIPIDTFDRYANLSIDAYCFDQYRCREIGTW